MSPTERARLLSRWSDPSSPNEVSEQRRAERMVTAAINAVPLLRSTDKRIYPKGSYANNTNVRRDSDVDIVVQNQEFETFDYYDEQPEVYNPDPYQGRWTKAAWREAVTEALCEAFDSDVDATGRVAVKIAAVEGSRPPIDVVPANDFRRFWDASRRSSSAGSYIYTRTGKDIVNWPDQQLANGRANNDRTGKRYKNFVRVLKNAENALVDDEELASLPSYLMECLIWNVPDLTLRRGGVDDAFRDTLVWLWDHLGDDYVKEEWDEPNELKYLFHSTQPWTRAQARELVQAAWTLLDY
jgi:hypothetical protein